MTSRAILFFSVIALLASAACSGRSARLPADQQDASTIITGVNPTVGKDSATSDLGGDAASNVPAAVGMDGGVSVTDAGGTAPVPDMDASVGGDGLAVADGGPTSAPGCQATCGTHRWACWPMPNSAAAGLPNPARYADNGDGTVTDDVTCLKWQKAVSASTHTVAQGRAYCATFGSGWRMGTRIEMMSIDDLTQAGAKVDPTAFPGTPADFFKTGSEWVLATKQIGSGRGTDFGWVLNVADGITVNNLVSASTPNFVRCVRGGGDSDLDTAPGALAVPPPNQYSVIASGEVQDHYTGLIWQRGYSGATMASVDATNYCAMLGLNGHTWRVPSIRELSTLVDESQVAPAIQRTTFPGTKWGANNWYWASDRVVGSTAAWALNYDDGFTAFSPGAVGPTNQFTTASTRCVR